MKSITKRWFLNSLSLVIVCMAILMAILILCIRVNLYGIIKKQLVEEVDNCVSYFEKTPIYNLDDFNSVCKQYASEVYSKGQVYISDYKNNVIFESSNFNIKNSIVQNVNKENLYVYKTDTGEKYLINHKKIYDYYENYIGTVSSVALLENADNIVLSFILLFLLIFFIIIIFIVLSNIYFIKSITSPVREMGIIAKGIAQGNFKAKVVKKNDDEIGDLCDIINYMANELSTSEQLKNEFISSVSHELRTPLTAIKGWAETMQMPENRDSETLEKGMRIIVREAERLSGIVEELLDFSRIQSGRMVLMMDKIDILAELDEAVYMFRERAVSENKKLIYQEPQKISPVFGDKNKIKQVFINIIDNAIKYTQSNGTITICIREEGSKVKITISDDGCGISREHLPKVKNKFYQADHVKEGSGIGLAIADEIVNLHDGILDIESEENVGTIVTICIPVIKNEQNESYDEL